MILIQKYDINSHFSMCSFRMRVRSNAAGLRVSIIHSYRWNVISYVYNRDCNSSKLTHFYTVFQQGYWWYWFLDYWLTNRFININTRYTLTRRDKNTRDDTQSRVMNDLITRRSPTLEKKRSGAPSSERLALMWYWGPSWNFSNITIVWHPWYGPPWNPSTINIVPRGLRTLSIQSPFVH